jgi:hypothetical protein
MANAITLAAPEFAGAEAVRDSDPRCKALIGVIVERVSFPSPRTVAVGLLKGSDSLGPSTVNACVRDQGCDTCRAPLKSRTEGSINCPRMPVDPLRGAPRIGRDV